MIASFPLSQVFLTHARVELLTKPLASEELELHLQAIAQRGHLAWPELAVPAATFVQHLAERLVRAPDAEATSPSALAQSLARLHVDDLYLVCACLHGNRRAAEVLSRDYLGQIPYLIAHMRLSKEELDDIRQSLGERLLVGAVDGRPRLAEYSGQGALLSWIRIAALRRALDHRRRQQHRAEEQNGELLAATVPDQRDVQQEYLKRRYREHFEEALRNALTHLSAEQRNILRLHFVDGLSIDRLGVLFKIHRATAARWIVSARRALLLDVRAQLQQRLNLTTSEVDSLARLVRSQLHLSLHRLLCEPDGHKELL